MSQRKEEGRRFRNAREDASVGAIERRIEKDYGLPSGTVQINRADGGNARSDKKVGNLKKEFRS
ncbi:hypothetical protein [Paenibacillus silvae]|uniref:hypothetical protein n=1 Tax=Paenibacillus silvae TaxID=1325358 RepID=UPI0020056A98|nr:hypothetical protein [Paenibacillus silvae]MCK6075361.1 hypothetical protein [Paenibacillus silvae]MCK6149748.1 hypothetical protein [Paenibacillus silvae]MCK6268046.1 hypothetical protein [Paenibacillus silvae]UOK62231.1 hypothetical protein MT997_28595 [Paenibacillus sp. OVF10]